jgi:transcriptional regulator with XRE-family HTH domain
VSSGAGGPGEFAARLRRFRERAVLTQEELAERTQVDREGDQRPGAG